MSRNHKAPGDSRRNRSNKVRLLNAGEVAALQGTDWPSEGYFRRLVGIEEMRAMLEYRHPNQPVNRIGVRED